MILTYTLEPSCEVEVEPLSSCRPRGITGTSSLSWRVGVTDDGPVPSPGPCPVAAPSVFGVLFPVIA